MAQYIDKDALVAEIERLREDEYPCDTFEESTGYYNALDEIATFIDTLEVKEVDLEKELVNYHNENFSPCDDGTLLSSETGAELTWYDYESIAKHFFELGLKAQKGEEV